MLPCFRGRHCERPRRCSRLPPAAKTERSMRLWPPARRETQAGFHPGQHLFQQRQEGHATVHAARPAWAVQRMSNELVGETVQLQQPGGSVSLRMVPGFEYQAHAGSNDAASRWRARRLPASHSPFSIGGKNLRSAQCDWPCRPSLKLWVPAGQQLALWRKISTGSLAGTRQNPQMSRFHHRQPRSSR